MAQVKAHDLTGGRERSRRSELNATMGDADAGTEDGSGGRGRASCARWSGRVGGGAATARRGARPRSRGCASAGVRLVVSTMRYAPQPGRVRGGGLDWHHMPVRRPQDGADVLEELLPLLRRELRRRGAVAVHGNRHTDFVRGGLRGAPARGPRRRTSAEALDPGGARAGLDGHAARRLRAARRATWAQVDRRLARTGQPSTVQQARPASRPTATRLRLEAVQRRRLVGCRALSTRAASQARPPAAGAPVGVEAVADHERAALAEPIERGVKEPRRGLADDLGLALGRGLDGGQHRARARPRPVGHRAGGVARGGEQVGAALRPPATASRRSA